LPGAYLGAEPQHNHANNLSLRARSSTGFITGLPES
jgi:hypothetical protein